MTYIFSVHGCDAFKGQFDFGRVPDGHTSQACSPQPLHQGEGFKNCGAIGDEKIKSHILKSSIFAIAKSGTISLEICNAKVPSVIIYKMGMINFFIVKMLVKVRFANIINIAAKEEIIPELLQSKCNPTDIYNMVDELLNNKSALDKQVNKTQEIIRDFKTEKSSKIASSVLINSL